MGHLLTEMSKLKVVQSHKQRVSSSTSHFLGNEPYLTITTYSHLDLKRTPLLNAPISI